MDVCYSKVVYCLIMHFLVEHMPQGFPNLYRYLTSHPFSTEQTAYLCSTSCRFMCLWKPEHCATPKRWGYLLPSSGAHFNRRPTRRMGNFCFLANFSASGAQQTPEGHSGGLWQSSNRNRSRNWRSSRKPDYFSAFIAICLVEASECVCECLWVSLWKTQWVASKKFKSGAKILS